MSFRLCTKEIRYPIIGAHSDGSKLWGDGFEIETMINIRAAADGLKVAEVPSIEHARIHGESNLNTFRDGTRVLRTIMSEWFRARRLRRQATKGVPVAKGGQATKGVPVAKGGQVTAPAGVVRAILDSAEVASAMANAQQENLAIEPVPRPSRRSRRGEGKPRTGDT